MVISLDLLQTVGLAVIVFYFGRWVKQQVRFLQTYFIPAPVVGGLIFSVLVLVAMKGFGVNVKMDATLQNFFMNLFFTCIGFTVSLKVIKQSGKQGAILSVVAVALLFIQNGVGVALCDVFGINKLLGIAMGSISMSGGVGSGAAFGPTLEKLGADGATTIGVAAATFGLLMGSLVGGPVAKRLIDKYGLASDYAHDDESLKEKKASAPFVELTLLNAVLIVLLAAAGGTLISALLKMTHLTFPYYVGCLFGGAVVRNIADARGVDLHMPEINAVGNITLNLFLSITLMRLNLAKLASLAGPMLVILMVQSAVMMIYAYFVTFRSMGKSYDAAVMAAGHCGVGLGQTPNAIANMASVIERNGPAPNAWFVLPVITVVFINLLNPVVITLFINLFSGG
ncbi:sodium/glutamate symporter [Oleispirillum naphthae]|uniref:sodium/glutamate symporter n=1 Tax=Oleispirillum naphthae TaxID=2838853 RepID=UPI0030824BFF